MGNKATTQRIERAHRTGILSLAGQQYHALPVPIAKELQHQSSTLAPLLKSLDLSNNKFTSIPLELGQLTQLRLLNVSHNNISALTEEQIVRVFHQLHRLEHLDLNHNRIQVLPAFFFGQPESPPLQSLKLLYLAHNNIQAVPETISNLKELVVLDLSHNALTSVPGEALAVLHATLEELKLEYNTISQVPEALASLEKLTLLYMDHNKIQGFPGAIFKRTRVKTVSLEDNPITLRQLMEIDGYQQYEQRRKGRVDQLVKTV